MIREDGRVKFTFGCRYHVSWSWWYLSGRTENVIQTQPRRKELCEPKLFSKRVT